MNVFNMATVSVTNAAGGTEILSAAQAALLTSLGIKAIVVYPSVEIALIDVGGANPIWTAMFPDAVAGTTANSPFVCPAGQATVITHNSGPLRAIANGGASTVKRGGSAE